MNEQDFRAGFVALVGEPNAGKSTLINALVKEQVAIVSLKAQTTRNLLQGIVHTDKAQIILVDTPGLTDGKQLLNQALSKLTAYAYNQADLVLLLLPLEAKPVVSLPLLNFLKRESQKKIIMLLNKSDRIKNKALLAARIQQYRELYQEIALTKIIAISALTGHNLDVLLQEICNLLPLSPPLFAEDTYTDQTERFICSELIREQLLLNIRQEVPHSAAVIIDNFIDERPNLERPLCKLLGRIIVERDSQKIIIVGKEGKMIKDISQKARLRLEKFLQSQVYLRLTVKVDKHWTQKETSIARYGIKLG